MKKSNRILLITTLSFFVIILFPQWITYRKFIHKEISAGAPIDHSKLVKIPMAAPRYISIRGLYIASVIPSDTFAIEYSKVDDASDMSQYVGLVPDMQEAERHTKPRYYREGDTLFINGLDTLAEKNALGQPMISKATWVRVYCRNIDMIRLNVVKAYLQGDSLVRTSTTRLILHNTNLEIGPSYPMRYSPTTSRINYKVGSDGSFYGAEYVYNWQLYYDSLSIATESGVNNIALNGYCLINKLDLQSTQSSYSFSDNGASIGQFTVDSLKNNSYNLIGFNLRKIIEKKTP